MICQILLKTVNHTRDNNHHTAARRLGGSAAAASAKSLTHKDKIILVVKKFERFEPKRLNYNCC
jgi:hypothetical protein